MTFGIFLHFDDFLTVFIRRYLNNVKGQVKGQKQEKYVDLYKMFNKTRTVQNWTQFVK